MINLKLLRKNLENHLGFGAWNSIERKKISERITIKRKKKMILEQSKNGNTRAVRKNYIKIEIIE